MDPLDKFFLELKQAVKLSFFASHLAIQFSRIPDNETMAVCQRIANSPGFTRIPHKREEWEVDTMYWFFALPAGIPRVPLAKALLESFQKVEIKGIAEFSAIDQEDDPSFPLKVPVGQTLSKTLEELRREL